VIQTNASASTIGGGLGNVIQTNAYYSSIGGGNNNGIQANAANATIGGGVNNLVQPSAYDSTIGGGTNNVIQANANDSTIGGGDSNQILPNSEESTIAGGYDNGIANSSGASTIGGGSSNGIGTNATQSTIAGGASNVIQSNSPLSTIGGGGDNLIQTGAYYSIIGGGFHNVIWPLADHSTIAGGNNNGIDNSANDSFIGGGTNNQIGAPFGTVGGGLNNSVTGMGGTVPGGIGNYANGPNSFAAGTYAQAFGVGSFVWADSQGTAFSDTDDNQFLIRAQGGVGINKNNPATALDVYGTASATMFAGGSIGLGTGSPSFAVDVLANQAVARLITTNNSNGADIELKNTSSSASILGAINFNNAANGYPGQIAYSSGNTMSFRVAGNGSAMLLTSSSLTVNGTVVVSSDRNVKQDIQPVDSRSMLEKVSQLPVATWAYTNDPGTKHLGPMAQDFYAAFGTGVDDRHIAVVDEGGVALAAIQGLNEKVESGKQKAETQMDQLAARSQRLETENAELKARLEKLEQLMTEKLGGAQ
jgi:hypothetical protein